MNDIAKRASVLLLAAPLVVVFAPVLSQAQSGLSPLVPPQSHAFGKSFQEWNVLQTQWAIATGLGGQTNLNDTVGRVRFLPGSFFDPTPVFEIRLSPGTPFVASPFLVFGERYDDPSVPDDDPTELAAFLEEILSTAEVQIVLNGQVLLEDSGAQLKQFWYGPTYFEEPIIYAEPQPRGPNLNSVAALWVTGIGAVYHPLPVGQHTLVHNVQSSVFGNFVFTYKITVVPR